MISRDIMIEKLAQFFTDNADLDNLIEYYLEGQLKYYESLSDRELVYEINALIEEGVEL